jgi:hypothetical protein
MGRATTMLTAFHAGEWRATVHGRIDHERYHVAGRRIRNFAPLVEGALELRPGTRYVAAAISPSGVGARSTLIPFKFNTSDAYALELGELTMHVFRNHAQVESSPGTPFSIATPYTGAQASAIQWTQSADVMWLCHVDVPTQRLTRTGHAAWSMLAYTPKWAPFRGENLDETLTLLASNVTGAITLAASAALFTPNDVGRLVRFREVIESKHPKWDVGVDPINVDTGAAHVDAQSTVHWEGNVYRLFSSAAGATGTRPPIHVTGRESDGKWEWDYLHSGAGYARITGFTDAMTVTAEVVKVLPDSVATTNPTGVAGAATFRWAFGAWDHVSGYPRALCFYEDRLWFFGTRADPDRAWATRPGGDYDDFRESDDAEGALAFRLNSAEPNVIESVVATKVLNLLTSGGIFPAAGIDPAKAVSIENLLDADRQLSYGAAPGVQALAIDSVVVFLQRSRRQVREVLFDFDESAFQAPDLARVAAHLLAPGVARLAYQQEPNRTLWCPCRDGSLPAATYDRPQEVLGWYGVELGGSAPFVESLCVIPHPEEDQDEVWLAVERNFGGTITRTIEFFERGRSETTLPADVFYVDSGTTYDGPPATVIAVGARFEGQSVRILADGARVADQVVSGGNVTLLEPASKVHAGFGYDGLLIPLRIEAGGDDGVSQGKTGRVHGLVIRFHLTGEGTEFGTLEAADELTLRDLEDVADAPVEWIDGDTVFLPFPGGPEQARQLVIRHRAPTPCTVVAMMPQLIVGER